MTQDSKEKGHRGMPRENICQNIIDFDSIYTLPKHNHRAFLKSYAALSEVGL